jgi:hypothetical protein
MEDENTTKYGEVIFVSGILICLAGAGLMFDGAILGETTTNFSKLLRITGIYLISTPKKAINKRR